MPMATMTTNATGNPRATQGKQVPKKGDRFRCATCGMEMQVTVACSCQDPDHVRLECCGQEMQKT
jgi:hypothetical protein